MLERIKTSLCHPKYVGLFFKDKFHKVILAVLIFFLLFSAGVVTKCMLTDQFGSDEAFAVEKIIQYSTDANGNKAAANISFDITTKKITGKATNFNSDSAVIAFLPTQEAKTQNAIYINLFEDHYVIYYGLYKLGSGDYNDSNLKSFNIAMVQNGDTENCINFRTFLITIFDRYQYQEAAIIAAQGVISALVYYVFVIILCLLSAYFLNPTIEFKIRIKLVLYDSVSYFYWYLIALLIDVSWVQYIALLVPFVFTSITFAHIKRIR